MERELGVLKASYLNIAALVGGETKVSSKSFPQRARNYTDLSLFSTAGALVVVTV